MPINRQTTKTVVAQFIGHTKGITIVELLFAMAVLLLVAMTGSLFLYNFLKGRELQTSSENLVSFLKTAQANAIETETVHAVFIYYNQVSLIRYPSKEYKEVQANLFPEEGEMVNSQKFKNKVICSSVELNGVTKAVLQLPQNIVQDDIAILVNEKGEFDTSNIVLAKEEERCNVRTDGRQVTVKTLESNELPIEEYEEEEEGETASEEEFLVAQTEPLVARGWQTIQVNNVDKVKEIRLRVRLDNKLPTTGHIHAVIFPGKYEYKNISAGVLPEISALIGDFTGKVYVNNLPNKPALPGAAVNFYKNNQLMGMSYSGEGGIYIMENLPYGMYTITCTLANYLTTTLNGVTLSQPQQVVDIPMNLPTMYTMKVYVNDEESGEPIEGSEVSVIRQGGGYQETKILSGDYIIFSGLIYGTYQITAEPPQSHSTPNPQEITILMGSTQQLWIVNFSCESQYQSSGLNASFFENTDETLILGDWNHPNSELISNAVPAKVAVFEEPTVYCLYKNKTEQLDGFIQEFPTLATPKYFRYTGFSQDEGFFGYDSTLNTFAITSDSSFPCNGATLLNEYWNNGYVSSKFASIQLHSSGLKGEEIERGEYSSWLVIKTSGLAGNTTFLKIAISAYHRKSAKECVFNCYPTSSSNNSNDVNVNQQYQFASAYSTLTDATEENVIDYPTDPMLVTYPWLKWGDDPLWLSNYGYMLKPLIRSNSLDILATRGPNENYKNNEPYNNYWYGQVLLDWDKILGEEGILSVLGWVSGAFELNEWVYKQSGDTYGVQGDWQNPTHAVSPSHYWLRSFSGLSYWYLFNYTAYFSSATALTKRIQLPFNLLTKDNAEWLKIWTPTDAPSSLSVPLINEPSYPLLLSSLPALFGVQRINCSVDFYSSYFYLMERINHAMLDTAAYIICTSGASAAQQVWNNVSNGNLDKWRIEIENIDDNIGQEPIPSYPRATWWNWYTSIPWAKGIAFPVPCNGNPRKGWESAIVEPYPPDSLFASGWSTLNPQYQNTLKNQPNTIFMSTAHYPLGIVQISVKKK